MNNSLWVPGWSKCGKDLAALALIAGFFVLFFHPVFLGGKYFIVNDAFVELYPLRTVMWDELRNGRLPLWTPLVMCGYPILSMAQNAVGYPLTWGHLFLPSYWAEQIYTLTPYLLTPAFVYAYARKIKLSRLASMLAALTFGYGGLMVSAVANNGLLPNAVMWLPLMLMAIDQALTRPFVPCLLGATGAYTMSVLTGVGQGFLYVGLIAVSYALFLVLVSKSLTDEGHVGREWKDLRRWKPLAVAALAILLSVGVTAFQILETMRASRRSIRSVLSYELFSEGAYTVGQAFKAFLFPLHYVNNATPCAPLLVMLLVVFAVVAAARNRGRDVRIFFWLAVALAAWVLMLGPNTPVYRLLYQVPIINRFRAPARNAIEWTFAIAILGAYGWDAAKAVFACARTTVSQGESRKILAGLALLLVDLVIVILWREDFASVPPLWDESNHYPAYPEMRYLTWKIAFALLATGVVWVGWKIDSARWRSGLLAGVIAMVCFVEPSIMASRWWWPALKTQEQLTTPSATTRFLQNYPAEQNRIYTRAALWNEEYQQNRRLDPGNLTMLYGLRNVGGYEPLILERYSRTLGNVWMDVSHPLPGFKENTTLFHQRSHVLDILNTSFVISYADLSTDPIPQIERNGIRFGFLDIARKIEPGQSTYLEGAARECDTIALVSSLAYSDLEANGVTVAKLRLITIDGRVIEREVRAGVDTAEWAHDRPDVVTHIRHQLAPVFESIPDRENGNFAEYRYWTQVPLGERVRLDHIEIKNVSERATFFLSKMTLYDSATRSSMPLPHYDLNRWEPVYQKDGVEIIRNKRALPRVWLVAEAEAVNAEEALSRIRGDSETPFDPRRTALLEVLPNELPRLPGGPVSSDWKASLVSVQANGLVIETSSPAPSVLVVSEVNYPGWTAKVDGEPAPILATDFVLRGVVLPAGSHQVSMVYTAPAARNGVIISLLTLLLIFGLGLYYRLRCGP